MFPQVLMWNICLSIDLARRQHLAHLKLTFSTFCHEFLCTFCRVSACILSRKQNCYPHQIGKHQKAVYHCLYISCDTQYHICHTHKICCVMVITTAQLHSSKPKIRFCAGLNPARSMSEIGNSDYLWHWSWLSQKHLSMCTLLSSL